MVKNHGMEAMELESDSETAVLMINEEFPENSPHNMLIRECKALLVSTRPAQSQGPRDLGLGHLKNV